MKKSRKLVIASLLLAANIVLGRFLSIRTPIVTIGFSFIPLMLAGILLGYKYTFFIGLLSDLIGAILFPVGPYFVGYTISNALTGLLYGILLHEKEFHVNKKYIFKLTLSVLIVNILINGCLNTYWLILTTNKAVTFFAPVRFIKQLIMIPVKIITMIVISKQFEDRLRKLQND